LAFHFIDISSDKITDANHNKENLEAHTINQYNMVSRERASRILGGLVVRLVFQQYKDILQQDAQFLLVQTSQLVRAAAQIL